MSKRYLVLAQTWGAGPTYHRGQTVSVRRDDEFIYDIPTALANHVIQYLDGSDDPASPEMPQHGLLSATHYDTDLNAAPSDGDSPVWHAASSQWLSAPASGGGVTDHGALTGLADDDHPQYTTDAEAATIAGTAVSTHAAAGDPHTGYQKESEKGQASGYASLDGSGTVPDAQLPAGLARDSEVTSALTAYQPTSAKGQVSGYASLDGSGTVPDAQLPAGLARDSEVTSAVSTHEAAGDPHTGYQRESEKAAASGYASLGADSKVPAAQLPAVTAATTAVQDTFLASGGQVAWQSSYVYLVQAGSGYINGTLVTWAQQTITLDAAHATLDRIDVIAVNSSGTAVKIAGTAAANPSEPVTNPDTQLKLALVTVGANTSQPTVTSELIYAENAGSGGTPAEWNWTTTGTGWTLGSASGPRTGTKVLRGAALSAGATATGQRGTGTLDPNNYSQLVCYLQFASAWANNRYLLIWLANAGVKKGNALKIIGGQFGLDGSNTTDFQGVVIPMIQFAVPAGTLVNQVVIQDVGGSISFALDDMVFQSVAGGTTVVWGGIDQATADARYAQRQNNLSDLASAATTRTNIGAAPNNASYVTTAAEAGLSAESLLSAVIGRGATGAKPAAGVAGRLYFDTTLNTLQRDNGSTWDNVESVAVSGFANPMTTNQDMMVAGTNTANTNQATSGAGATFSDGGSVNGGNAVGNAFDSSDSTHADYNSGGPRYLAADLSALKTIGSYRVLQGSGTNAVSDAQLQYSLDNSTWIMAASLGSFGDTGVVSLSSPITARYWRLYSPGGASAVWQVKSIELYGSGGTAGAPTRLPVGSSNQVLTVDPTSGAVSWRTVAGHPFAVGMHNGTLVPSVSGSALTLAVKTLAGADPSAADPVTFFFRSATAANGDYSAITVTAALSVVVSSGSTLGAVNSTAFRIWVVAFNDAGTVRLGVINCLSGTSVYPLAGWGIASSTAEGGAGAADSAQVFYTGTAVSSKAYSVLGWVAYESGLATAGTWSAAPTRAQLLEVDRRLPGDRIQTQRTTDGAVATTTTQIPVDDTIPQSTEGGQFASQAITPTSAANLLEVDFGGLFAATGLGNITVALFQDATANALAAVTVTVGGSGYSVWETLRYVLLAALTSSTTFKIRAGFNASGTVTYNGFTGARSLGGVMGSFIEVREIMA